MVVLRKERREAFDDEGGGVCEGVVVKVEMALREEEEEEAMENGRCFVFVFFLCFEKCETCWDLKGEEEFVTPF